MQWIHARIGDQWSEPLSPKQIWVLGETDQADVRDLVPSMPAEYRSGAYREFATDLEFISSSTAKIEDYIRLLKLLPERYPLDLQECSEDDRKSWRRSIRAVFNWVCERLQTGLGSRGDDVSTRPDDLQVVAFRQGELCYVPVDSPELVYPDDSFMEKRWEPFCAFLRINSDWGRLRQWLGVSRLSDVVRSVWRPEGELKGETRVLQAQYDQTLPFYLALIRKDQPSRYEGLIGRLERLRFRVVKRLAVEERIDRLADVDPVVTTARVHLEKHDEPNRPGIPGTVRTGDLYLTQDAAENLDLLGSYVADYVEIDRLGDAFVILISRDSEGGKQRFLESKGVESEALQEIASDRKTGVGTPRQASKGDSIIGELIATAAAGAVAVTATPTIPIFTVSGDDDRDDKGDDEDQTPPTSKTPLVFAYPQLDLENPPEPIRADPTADAIQTVRRPGGGGGAGGFGRPPSEEVSRELGQRGEEWVYAVERKRLADLDYDTKYLEQMGELVWLAKNQPTANHDIRSIWGMEGREDRPLYIEVKATSGDECLVRMSRSEFELALGMGEDYWLCWVANVDQARPDPPVYYPNLAKLISENKVILNVDKLAMTLPRHT